MIGTPSVNQPPNAQPGERAEQEGQRSFRLQTSNLERQNLIWLETRSSRPWRTASGCPSVDPTFTFSDSTTFVFSALNISSAPSSRAFPTWNVRRTLRSSWFHRSRYLLPGGARLTVTACVRPPG